MNRAPHSYRDDPQVPPFPDEAPLFVFDGVCVLCSGFARFILRHDTRHRIRLCPAQSPLGQALYRHYGLNAVAFATNLLVARGLPFTKSEAFIETMREIGGLCALAVLLRACPRIVRDWFYDPIARNRYRWFGERTECYVPAPDERGRFLP